MQNEKSRQRRAWVSEPDVVPLVVHGESLVLQPWGGLPRGSQQEQSPCRSHLPRAERLKVELQHRCAGYAVNSRLGSLDFSFRSLQLNVLHC